MEQTAKAKGRSKFISRPFRTIVIITVALCAAAILALGAAIHNYQAQIQALKDQAAQLEAENAELLEDIDQVDSIHGIVEIAKEELGLVEPDAVFYQPES